MKNGIGRKAQLVLFVFILSLSLALNAQAMRSEPARSSVYLVGLKGQADAAPVKSWLLSHGATLKAELPKIGGLIVRANAQVAKALSALPQVEFVEADALAVSDRRPTALSKTSEELPLPSYLSTDPWMWSPSNAYDWWAVALNADKVHSGNGIMQATKGKGVAICAIDSGLEASHPEFAGAVDPANFVDFSVDPVQTPYEPNDERGHGTSTIGMSFSQEGSSTGGDLLQMLDRDMDGTVAGASMNPAGITGIAPEATLYMAKFGDNYESTWDTYKSWRSDFLQSIDWCTDLLRNRQENRVVITTTVNFSNSSRLELRAIQAAWKQGALIVSSAGNTGSEYAYYPTAYENVIGVGGVNLYGEPWEWETYGSTIDFIAPSTHVLTTAPMGTSTSNFYVPAVSNASLFGYYSTIVTGSALNAFLEDEIVPADSDGKSTIQFCAEGSRNADLAGHIALIKRKDESGGDSCSYLQKVENAIASGATGVLIFDNLPEMESSGYYGASLQLPEGETVAIPVLMTSYEIGNAIYTAGKTAASMVVQPADYVITEGTSFSAPALGAAAALVWSNVETYDNAKLSSLLRYTANRLGQTDLDARCTGNSTDTPDAHYGCGLVDPLKAIQTVE